MADTVVSAFAVLTGANSAPLDLVPIIDVSDVSQGAGGTAKSITRQEFQTYNAGTLTTDVKVLDLSVTWNNAAVAFVGKTSNFTSTASAAASMMENWSMAGVRAVSLRKDGAALFWNGANDDTNYERGFVRWAANVLEIGSEKAGTGANRLARLFANGASVLTYGHGSTVGGASSDTNHGWIQFNSSTGGALASTTGLLWLKNNISTDQIWLGNPIGYPFITINRDSMYASRYAMSGDTFTFYVADEGGQDKAHRHLAIRPENAGASNTVNITGGNLKLNGGAGASGSAGAADGGHIYLDGGQGYGTGAHGDVIVGGARGNLLVKQGASSTNSNVVLTANINTTAVGNVDAGEDNLITYAMPASSFSAAGKGVHITAWGTTANNVNAKTLKLYFGTAVILTNALTASVAGVWRVEADVYSTGTDAQDYISQLVTTGTAGVALNDLESGTATQDDGAAITIKCTAEATTTNDVVQDGLRVTFIN